MPPKTKGIFKIEVRKNCKICGKKITVRKYRTYCSSRCRNKFHYLRVRKKLGLEEYNKRQREYLNKKRKED
jgi:predicted nucleic acid-binding Zn ribbon protein